MICRLISLKNELLDIFCYFRERISGHILVTMVVLFWFSVSVVLVRISTGSSKINVPICVNARVSRQQKLIQHCLPEITADKKISSAAR